VPSQEKYIHKRLDKVLLFICVFKNRTPIQTVKGIWLCGYTTSRYYCSTTSL